MSSGLLVIPGVSTLPCLPLMLSLKTIILKYLLVGVFLVSPWCVHRDRRPDQTVSVVPSPRFVLFVFSSVFFVPVFCPSRQASPHAASPHARRSREFMPPFAALPSRGSREFTPPFAALPSCGSREFTPPFAALTSRRSRELTPPFAAQRSHRSREFTPPFADQPAHSSQEMTPPSTANPSLPARRWLNARRPASDSMPAGLPLTQCPPDCRWLKLAGLPLTQARRIAADSWPLVVVGRESQLTSQFTPPSAAHRPRRSREITPPSVGKANPPSAAASSVAGKANPPSAVHSARSRLRLPPARRPLPLCGQARRLLPLFVKPAGYGLASRPLPYWQASRPCRIWPDCDQGLFNCLCVFSPGGLLIPWASPRKFWGGVVGLRPKRLRWGLGPRSLRRSHHGLPSSLLRHGLPSSQLRHGLPSSLLHLDLGLSVPLWRPRPVYVSVSVLWGLQSAHPPSLVVLLRHGTCLPGGGSYVRDLSCASCGSRLLFLYLVCFLSVVIIVYSCHLLC